MVCGRQSLLGLVNLDPITLKQPLTNVLALEGQEHEREAGRDPRAQRREQDDDSLFPKEVPHSNGSRSGPSQITGIGCDIEDRQQPARFDGIKKDKR